MTEQIRSAILYLLYQWPGLVPKTRQYLISFLYLLDKDGVFNIPWDISEGYINCKPLLHDLDDLGCLYTVKNSLLANRMPSIIARLTEEQIQIIDTFITEMIQCKTVIDAEKLRSRAKKLMLDRSERCANS